MSPEQKPRPDFEHRLLARLKAVVAERGAAATAAEAADAQDATPSWRRRAPRLALGVGVVLAAVAVALIVSAGGDNPSKAFAVKPQKGGGVTIKIYALEDASGLEQALEDAGIRAQVTWLPAGKVCREPHYKPSVLHLPGGGSFGGGTMGGPGGITIGIRSAKASRESFRERMHGDISADEMANINSRPRSVSPRSEHRPLRHARPLQRRPRRRKHHQDGSRRRPGRTLQAGPCTARAALAPSGPAREADPPTSRTAIRRCPKPPLPPICTRPPAPPKHPTLQFEAPPAPGQFLYAKTEVSQLEGWLPKGHGKGSKSHPRYFVPINDPSARYALVPAVKEVWTAQDGKTRVGETLGRVAFLSSANQKRWEAAGSPPPWAFDPSEHEVGRDSSGRPVKDFAANSFRGRHEFTYLSRLSRLPTEPEALRLAVENRDSSGTPLDPSPANSARGGATVERLLEILSEPITSRALRAAAFNALAEIPGIGFERDVADAAGGKGDAIGWVRGSGFGRRFIFDPNTGQILAEAEMIFGPKATREYGAPAGTPFRETAYLRSGIVDSTHEP